MKSKFKIKWLITSLLLVVILICSILLYMFLPRNYLYKPNIWTNTNPISMSTYQNLNMNGEEFTILQFTDIQVSNLKDLKSAEIQIRKMIHDTNPNLIILTGDNVSLRNNVLILKKFVSFFDSFQIPWATVLGNHDSEGIATRSYVAHVYENSKNCLFQNGPTNINGNGNYVLNITKENNIITSLILMDSNEYRTYNGVSGYDYIYPNQIEWYEWNVKNLSKLQYGEYNLNEGKVVPSLCFFHIPLVEYSLAYELYLDGVLEGSGSNDEACCCPMENTELFSKAMDLGSTKAFFFWS